MPESGLSVTGIHYPVSRNGTPCKLIPLCRQTPDSDYQKNPHPGEQMLGSRDKPRRNKNH